MVESPEPRPVGPVGTDTRTGAHMLGPHVVGQRVVVRRVLPGETGPSGGPALTDVLGLCRSWGRGLCEVEREDGSLVAIRIGDIVSGKPVPPRPSVRLRLSAADLHRHSAAMFPGIEREVLGDWLLRATPDRERARANSALAMGDPGMPLAAAADRVRDFYATRHQPAWVQVLADGDVDHGLTALGWVPARPGEGDVLVLVASVARVLRRLRQGLPSPVPDVDLETEGPRALAHLAGAGRARAVLEGDLVGLYDLWVAETHRRRGVATALTRAALDWSASQGATTAYLQVLADNTAATALYDRLGFTAHHAYRYLALPTVAP